MTDFTRYDRYLEAHLMESIDELATLTAQPSVSAQNWGLRECAELVGEQMKQRGFKVEILETGGAPVVYAERAGRSEKTLIIYTMMCSRPSRWNCGSRRHLCRPCATASCMGAG
jgi:hypothetical protein